MQEVFTGVEGNFMSVALLSVYNKEGIDQFAKQLIALGWEVLASQGTATALADAGVPAKDIATLVGGDAILDHRVVTLSREIHAGLLAQETASDVLELARFGIPRIDLLCADLYPLQLAVNAQGSTPAEVTEKTDIGGPALLRSAAKGRRIVICDAYDRQVVIDWLTAGRPKEQKFLAELAAKAEAVVANYCLMSARYHSGAQYEGMVQERVRTCQYGENPWQTPATLYSTWSNDPLALEKFQLVGGVEPSYNNFVDLDRLLQTITHIAATFERNRAYWPKIAVAVKHGNACGAAIADDGTTALKKTIIGDAQAIFGGAVMTNFPIDDGLAETLLKYRSRGAQRRLLDAIFAPQFSVSAVELLKRKSGKCRLLINHALANLNRASLDAAPRFRYVRGGFLQQSNYTQVLHLQHPALEKIGIATPEQQNDMLLAWAIGSTSNSNTVTLARDGHQIANAVGQQDRVGACKLAVRRATEAGHITSGSVAYSDSFFPFVDGPAVLAEAGVKAIFTSSGSVRDEEVRTYCRKRGLILYLIPDKLNRGFFGHRRNPAHALTCSRVDFSKWLIFDMISSSRNPHLKKLLRVRIKEGAMQYQVTVVDRENQNRVLDEFLIIAEPDDAVIIAYTRLAYRPIYQSEPRVKVEVDCLKNVLRNGGAYDEMDVGCESCNRIDICITKT